MDTLEFWLQAPLLWFLIGLALMLIEFMSSGILIVFFGVGAWIVSLICLGMNISLTSQLLIFLITSVLMLVTLRKWLKGRLASRSSWFGGKETDLEEFIGKRVSVQTKITPTQRGKVLFRGTLWEAEAEVEILKGASAEIIASDSIILIVKPLS